MPRAGTRAAKVRASRARHPARARTGRIGVITARRRTPGETSLAAGVYCTVMREVGALRFLQGPEANPVRPLQLRDRDI